MMVAGGQRAGEAYENICEQWNGSSWTEVADLNTARIDAGGCGDGALFLAAAGSISHPAPYSAVAEEWNGSSWAEGDDLNQPQSFYNSAGGTTTSAIAMGGQAGAPQVTTGLTSTEEWDKSISGSNWDTT
jgi:hypothetical protein